MQGTVVRHQTLDVFLQIQVLRPREGAGRAWDASPADVWNVIQGTDGPDVLPRLSETMGERASWHGKHERKGTDARGKGKRKAETSREKRRAQNSWAEKENTGGYEQSRVSRKETSV